MFQESCKHLRVDLLDGFRSEWGRQPTVVVMKELQEGDDSDPQAVGMAMVLFSCDEEENLVELRADRLSVIEVRTLDVRTTDGASVKRLGFGDVIM